VGNSGQVQDDSRRTAALRERIRQAACVSRYSARQNIENGHTACRPHAAPQVVPTPSAWSVMGWLRRFGAQLGATHRAAIRRAFFIGRVHGFAFAMSGRPAKTATWLACLGWRDSVGGMCLLSSGIARCECRILGNRAANDRIAKKSLVWQSVLAQCHADGRPETVAKTTVSVFRMAVRQVCAATTSSTSPATGSATPLVVCQS